MKFMANNKTEACCKWARSYLMNFDDFGKNPSLTVEMTSLQGDGDAYATRLNFCPNCGAKTEISEDEE